MPEPYPVKPDRELIRRIQRDGGENVKKCFQCATCSVVCELSNGGGRPFPRKEMIWAQWGLKDRIVADPDIWLCHQCNDCSIRCPRGARPGDVLAALRQETVRHYSVPRVFATWANSYTHLPLMLVIPVVLLVLALLLRGPIEGIGPIAGILSFMDHHGFYADLFPHWLLIGFYTLFWGLGVLVAAVGIARFWRAMVASDKAAGSYTPKVGIVPAFVATLKPIFSHGKFSQCEKHGSRRLAHLGAFYGFAALFIVSVWAVVALYLINPLIADETNHLAYPFGFWNPWKLLANVGCVLVIAGCGKAILDRKNNPEESGASTPFDWLFVWVLLGVAVTGLLTEGFRYLVDPGTNEPVARSALQYVAYAVYFVHLVLVFDLLVYLPFTKFAHIAYRTAALVYAEHSGRGNGHAGRTAAA